MYNAKYTQALEIALFARGAVAPEISEGEMREWGEEELYAWLSAWDYVWDGEHWAGIRYVWIALDEDAEWRTKVIGAYTSEAAAVAACTDRYHSYTRVRLNATGEDLEYVYPIE